MLSDGSSLSTEYEFYIKWPCSRLNFSTKQTTAIPPKNAATALSLSWPALHHTLAFDSVPSPFRLSLLGISLAWHPGLLSGLNMLSKVIAHHTWRLHLLALFWKEALFLAGRILRQYSKTLGENVQTFPYFHLNSSPVSVYLCNSFKRERMAQPSTLTCYFRLFSENVCGIGVLCVTVFRDTGLFKTTSLSSPASLTSIPFSSLPAGSKSSKVWP